MIDPKAIDPKHLATLGPEFQKSEKEVENLHLKKLTMPHTDPGLDFFFIPGCKNSTIPLQKLVPGTPLFVMAYGPIHRKGSGLGQAEK